MVKKLTNYLMDYSMGVSSPDEYGRQIKKQCFFFLFLITNIEEPLIATFHPNLRH